jgi:hypothetical protein
VEAALAGELAPAEPSEEEGVVFNAEISAGIHEILADANDGQALAGGQREHLVSVSSATTGQTSAHGPNRPNRSHNPLRHSGHRHRWDAFNIVVAQIFSPPPVCSATASDRHRRRRPRSLLVRADPRPVFGEHASAAQFRPAGQGRLHWAHLHFRCSIFASAAMNSCVPVVIVQPTTWTLHHRLHESDMLQFRD